MRAIMPSSPRQGSIVTDALRSISFPGRSGRLSHLPDRAVPYTREIAVARKEVAA